MMTITRTFILLNAFVFAYFQVVADEEPRIIEKRQRWRNRASPICAFSQSHKLIYESYDEGHNLVKIAQVLKTQYFQVTECAGSSNNITSVCSGVDSRQYSSKCQVTSSLQRAYVCVNPSHCINGRFAYIHVATGCACLVKAKAGPRG